MSDDWNSYVRRVDAATWKFLESAEDIPLPPEFSPARLDELSQSMDVYLRSPEFLAVLKNTIDTIIAAKTSLNRHFGGANRTEASEDTTAPSPATASGVDGDSIDGESAATSTTEPPSSVALHPASAASGADWDRLIEAVGQATPPDDLPVGATPYDIVYRDGSLKLLRYRSEGPPSRHEPVLVCFSLVNRPYILDLRPDRSVIRQLLARGLDVYLIDWGVPTPSDHTLRLFDYVGQRLKGAADFVCDYAHSPQVNLLGYCMGGTMSAIYAALHPQQLRNLILLATPIDFDSDESLLNLWAKKEYFDVDGLIDAFGNCPGSLLKICFQQLKPIQNYVQKYMKLHEKRGDEAFLDNFFAMERWANDSIPVAGETFREFVRLLYQQNLLVQGRLRLGGTPIDLRQITCPLLILTADLDHLVPLDSALAIQDIASSIDLATMSINAGHLGLAVSARRTGNFGRKPQHGLPSIRRPKAWGTWVSSRIGTRFALRPYRFLLVSAYPHRGEFLSQV